MTPEGHTLSAWITSSAYQDGGVTVAQAQALERPSDPLDELAYMLGGNRMNDRFWQQTLEALAHHLGVAEPTIDTVTAPVRWITRRGRKSKADARQDAPQDAT